MFDELAKYKIKGHFFFNSGDDLEQVCNAPVDKSGIYVVYALKNGKIELIYIGWSGKILEDGTMSVEKDGLGGIMESIVNGFQFGKIPRRISWLKQIENEYLEALDINWYVTHNEKFADSPKLLENKLLSNYFQIYGNLPRWNIEI